MHQVHSGCSPFYMSNLVTATANMLSRQALRSANSQRYEVPGGEVLPCDKEWGIPLDTNRGKALHQ